MSKLKCFQLIEFENLAVLKLCHQKSFGTKPKICCFVAWRFISLGYSLFKMKQLSINNQIKQRRVSTRIIISFCMVKVASLNLNI